MAHRFLSLLAAANLSSGGLKKFLEEIAAAAGLIPPPATTVTAADAAAGVVGTATDYARGDHKHQVTTGNPVAIATANNAGTSDNLARADHVHDHGNQTNPNQHAIVTANPGGQAGFMAPVMLDALIAADAWIGQRQHEMAARPEMAGPATSVLALTNSFQGSQNMAPFRGRFNALRARLTAHTVAGVGIRVAIYQVPGGLARGVANLLGESVVTPAVVGAQDLNFAFTPFNLERGYFYVLFGRSAVGAGTSSVQTWTIGTILRFTSGVAAGDVPTTFTTAVSSTVAAPASVTAPTSFTPSTLSQALCARLVG